MADQKFQVRYSAGEDRILILSGTGPEHVQCFALTRRMVGKLWPGLNRVISAIAPPTRSASTPDPSAPVTAAAAEPAADTANSAAPSAGADDNPFGAPPPATERHLVRKLQLVDRGERPRLFVLTANGAELRVPLDARQLTQVYEALRTVIGRAEWGIDLDAGLPDTATPEQPQGAVPDITAESPSRYRH